MNAELTPEEIKDCEDGMERMGFEKTPSSDTPKPIDLTHLERDMKFIAGMLHSSVIRNGNRTDFHVCEAWEVAKGYLA